MKIHDQHSFLERRLMLERNYFGNSQTNNILQSISSVDITTIDLCNRACVFCPRHDPKVYPNRNLRMTADGAAIIARKLKDIDYSGTIAISGFGENLLNPEIVDIVKQLKSNNPNAHVECNTNGDPLTTAKVHDLLAAGLDCLNINLYDGPEQINHFEKILKGIDSERYKYRAHYNPDDYGIIFNNRSGMISWMEDETGNLEEVKNSPCYYPFYKMYVDWNGDVLFCANDWGRVRVVGNLMQQSVEEVWMSKEMMKVRARLAKGNRNMKPCNTCNVKGTLIGKKSFDMLTEYYNENRSNRK